MQNIESSCYMNFPMEKRHIFLQISKIFYVSKNVQIPWLALPDPGPTLSIVSPTCSHYSISSLRETTCDFQSSQLHIFFLQLKLSFNFLSRGFPLFLQAPTDIQSPWRSLQHLLLLQGFWFPSSAQYTHLYWRSDHTELCFMKMFISLNVKWAPWDQKLCYFHHFYYLKHST